ncbi:uncharacterized protein J3R85_006103 [Psidium guajava]|nr:uncharacterized protein J3R85_006103 [Psidium guajava]
MNGTAKDGAILIWFPRVARFGIAPPYHHSHAPSFYCASRSTNLNNITLAVLRCGARGICPKTKNTCIPVRFDSTIHHSFHTKLTRYGTRKPRRGAQRLDTLSTGLFMTSEGDEPPVHHRIDWPGDKRATLSKGQLSVTRLQVQLAS